MARLSPEPIPMELLIEASVLAAGVALGVAAARLLLAGLLALTFGRGR